MRQFSGFLMWPILIVALSAFFNRGACVYCPTVDKASPIYLKEAMTTLAAGDMTACAAIGSDPAPTKCTECYTKTTESNHIKYIVGCAESTAKFGSTAELANYDCYTVNGCTAADSHTGPVCHTKLSVLVAATGSGIPPVKPCVHATLGATPSVTGTVVCHGADAKCAYGVGFGDDKTKKLGYMGCKTACEAAMKGKTTQDGKNYVTCTECGPTPACEKLNEKTPTAGDVIPQTTAKPGSASSPDGSSKATTTRGNGATTCTKASVMAIFATSAVVLRVFGLSL